MGHVTHTLECNTPVEYAFDYVTDYRLIPGWIMGVKRFTPIGEQTRDVGAQFDGEINLGPMSLNLLLDYTGWEDNKAFSARFSKGVEGTMTMHFSPLGEGKTRISAELDYRVGKGLVGKVLDKAIQAFVGPCLRHVDKNLTRQLHESYAKTATV